jgi:hypothetical protein
LEISKRTYTNNQGKENTVIQTEDDEETEKYWRKEKKRKEENWSGFLSTQEEMTDEE